MSGHPHIRLPDFLGIGAMRSGTSWLRRHLSAHPRIWMAEPKELHFFDRHFVDDPARYAAHFAEATAGVAVGEYTPAYAILPEEKIAIVRRWMPDLKLLYILRDPVARAWSHARKDFARFWNKPIEEANVDTLRPFFESPDVARRGDYAGCMEAWLGQFPGKQMCVSFMEDVVADPQKVLCENFAFLGIDAEAFDFENAGLSRPVNPRPSVPMPEGVADYLRDSLYAQNARLEELLGRPMPWARH